LGGGNDNGTMLPCGDDSISRWDERCMQTC